MQSRINGKRKRREEERSRKESVSLVLFTHTYSLLFIWFTCSIFLPVSVFSFLFLNQYCFWTNALMIKTMTTMSTTTTAPTITATIKSTFVYESIFFFLFFEMNEHFFLCYQWIVVNDTLAVVVYKCNTKQNNKIYTFQMKKVA